MTNGQPWASLLGVYSMCFIVEVRVVSTYIHMDGNSTILLQRVHAVQIFQLNMHCHVQKEDILQYAITRSETLLLIS